MMYNVLLTKQPNNLYTDRVMSLPDVIVSGTDDAEVLARVRAAIAHMHANSRLIQVEAPPLDEMPVDPWLRFAGMWEDDPDWDQFQSEIQAFRETIDRETASV